MYRTLLPEGSYGIWGPCNAQWRVFYGHMSWDVLHISPLEIHSAY